MSKKTKTVEKKPLSPNEKKTIIIAAICVVMAIILAVSLSLVLKKPNSNTPDGSDSSSGSSTLTIKNGDFYYFDKETDTYPKSADNWTKRTYQSPEENKPHGFDEITSDAKVVAGVVPANNEDAWKTVQKDLATRGVTGTVAFPDVHEDAADKNIYMFATKEATTAAIFSQTFSIASQVSAKITVWLNTSQIKDGNAVIVLQNGSGTLKADEDEWHAYNKTIGTENGWVPYEFYIFNRKSSSAVIICSVGLGNCYDGDTAEGVMFVDDITYETVSANEYRKFHDEGEDPSKTNYAIIEGDNTASDVEYFDWTSGVEGTYTPEQYLALGEEVEVDDEAYSPFIKDEKFNIFSVSNTGTADAKMLILQSLDGTDDSQPITIQSSEELKDHLHIGFWLRTYNKNGNAYANIILQTKNGEEWEDVKNGSFTKVETSQEIDTDKNCGWVKYDFYIKPTSTSLTQIRLIVTLGKQEGYASYEPVYYPQGTIFATNPVIEEITASEYKNGTGSYSKQVSLTDANNGTENFQISNGSFSNHITTDKNQPSNWTPVFAGQNEIYHDGKHNDTIFENIGKTDSDVWGGLLKNDDPDGEHYIVGDRGEKNILAIENKTKTSFGYLSEKFTLSAKTVYVLSVMAKVETGKNPYIYVVKDNPSNREDAFLGKIETAASINVDDTSNLTIGNEFGTPQILKTFQANLGKGWLHYYMIIVTGDESVAARLALFNGSIDGSKTQQGTVYYDEATWSVLGTYTVNTDEDEEIAKRDRIEFTAAKGYANAFTDLTDDELATIVTPDNVVSNADEWKKDVESIVDEAMKKPAETPTETETPTEKEPVNLGLLFGLLSSVALVGALLIVVVVKLFKKRNRG